MTAVQLEYAEPSTLRAGRDRADLGLAANLRRPVRFLAHVKQHVLPLRLALQALGEVVWSTDTWLSQEDYFIERFGWMLDPVITVHPDRLFFEAFSQDQSTYGLVVADRELFEPEGEVQCGTTNVDFTSWLWHALGEMRSSRQTWFRIEAAGFAVKSEGVSPGRIERKVDLPDSWVRGFLQLQGAMAMPGTRIVARPVDVLAAIRFLGQSRARTPPRALRYEFEPGQPVRIVLEPWEQVIPLKGTEHNYTQKRVIRTWGRRRLKLLEPLLPYADSVAVYLKGRALPSFYAVRLPGVTFLLGLSGWTGNSWTGTGSFDLLTADVPLDDRLLRRAVGRLAEKSALSVEGLARALRVTTEVASALLARLCRQGRAIYDVERREYRHRELFEEPLDEAKYFPPEPRKEAARKLLDAGRVKVAECETRETRKTRIIETPEGPVTREVVLRDWRVTGSAGDQPSVEVVVNDTGRMIFGTCGCPFFKDNLLNRGPCEHLLALFLASADRRQDLPTSRTVSGAATVLPRRRRTLEDFDEEAFDSDAPDE